MDMARNLDLQPMNLVITSQEVQLASSRQTIARESAASALVCDYGVYQTNSRT